MNASRGRAIHSSSRRARRDLTVGHRGLSRRARSGGLGTATRRKSPGRPSWRRKTPAGREAQRGPAAGERPAFSAAGCWGVRLRTAVASAQSHPTATGRLLPASRTRVGHWSCSARGWARESCMSSRRLSPLRTASEACPAPLPTSGRPHLRRATLSIRRVVLQAAALRPLVRLQRSAMSSNVDQGGGNTTTNSYPADLVSPSRPWRSVAGWPRSSDSGGARVVPGCTDTCSDVGRGWTADVRRIGPAARVAIAIRVSRERARRRSSPGRREPVAGHRRIRPVR